MKSFLIIFVVFEITNSFIIKDEPVVLVKNGLVRGRNAITKELGKPYVAFQGIPFAKPPIDDLRFAPPEPAEDWIGTLDAIEDKKFCLQINNNNPKFQEDCLYLNVYTPSINTENLPVMVWIYGGEFIEGDLSYSRFAPDYFVEEDIVFVTLNYRVGILGFYSTEDEIAPGNAGLKDQIAALKWVNQNIKQFSGNPNNVTLLGQSAGSASVSYLILAEQTKGLFQKAILQSGSAISTWALARNKRESVFLTGRFLGVETNDSSVLLNELRKKSGYDLILASLVAEVAFMGLTNPLDGLLFSPNVEPEHDGAVVTGRSLEKLENGDFQQVPTIIGYNSEEGLMFYKNLKLIRIYMVTYIVDKSRLVPLNMNVNDMEVKRKIGKGLAEFYHLQDTIETEDVNIIQFLTDNMFSKGIHKAAQLHSRFAPVYFYRFNYVGNLSSHFEIPGATHGGELHYLFANRVPQSNNDKLTKNRLVTLWSNFAKTSNPTPIQDELLDNITWSPFSEDENNYLDISDDIKMAVNPDEKNIGYWNDLYEAYGNPPYDTY